MPTGREIMKQASVILNDDEYVRWPMSELKDWINEGVRAIVLAKPSASSKSIALKLAVGTLQYISADSAPAVPLSLVKIVRNLKSDVLPRVGSRTITATLGTLLDAQDPFWHDPLRTRYKKEALHYVYDENNPLEFYVYPGNDGTGVLEAIISFLPDPLKATGSENEIASYAGEVGLPEPYSVPLLDYVLYRALSKDDLTGNPTQAGAHYQQFATAVGLKIQVEAATTPNARRSA